MPRIAHRGQGLVLLAVMTLAGAVAARPVSAQAGGAAADLAKIKAGLKKYEDPFAAVMDGYYSTVGCVIIEQAGAPGHIAYKPGGMGVHFINLNLVSPVVDPAKPQGLLYEPHGGKLTLTGAEWFVPLATGVKKRPTLLGHPFNGPMMGHPPLLPMGLTHYDLHVWLYKPNPLGMFEPTNPDVKCTGEAYRVVEVAPMLVAEPKP